jgi:prepilin-type processing-associated H-X9-DG protein
MYPEYVNDYNVFICPSDPLDSKKGGSQSVPERWQYAGNVDAGLKGKIDPKRIDSTSYMYMGWLIGEDEVDLPGGAGPNDSNWELYTDGNAVLLVAVQNCIADTEHPEKRDEDLDVDSGYGNAGGSTLYRLREGIERFLITDINNAAATAKAQSEIAVLYDSLSATAGDFNHVPGGANCLYMDGHVVFQRYPGDFPASRAWAIVFDTVSDM